MRMGVWACAMLQVFLHPLQRPSLCVERRRMWLLRREESKATFKQH